MYKQTRPLCELVGSLSKNVADHFRTIKTNFPMSKMHPVAFGGPAFCLPVLFCGNNLSPSVLQRQYSCPRFDPRGERETSLQTNNGTNKNEKRKSSGQTFHSAVFTDNLSQKILSTMEYIFQDYVFLTTIKIFPSLFSPM